MNCNRVRFKPGWSWANGRPLSTDFAFEASRSGVKDESEPSAKSLEKRPHLLPTTTSVPIAPATTDMIGVVSSATSPDSKPPNSLEEPMNIELTAETRPRISFGVLIWVMTCRITMLTLSNAPVSASAAIESQKFVEKPNTMVATPKPATDQ